MPRRLVTAEIWLDKRVLKLPDTAKLVWVGMITQSDDEGILDPDPYVLRACMALNAPPDEVAAHIDHIIKLGLAVAYQVNGAPLAFLPAFYKHQRLNRPTPSSHARPPDDLLLDYPDYLDGRFAAFNQATSRHRGLFKQPRGVDESMPSHGHGADSSKTRPRQVADSQHDVMGCEVKRSDVKTSLRQGADSPPTPQGGLSASGRETQSPTQAADQPKAKPYVSPNVFEPVLTRGKPAESFNRHGLGLPPLSPTRKPLDFNNPANFPSQAELDQILGPRTPAPTEPTSTETTRSETPPEPVPEASGGTEKPDQPA